MDTSRFVRQIILAVPTAGVFLLSMGVQCYLGGTSVQHDKPIHQPGTL